ncbi:MAG: acyltransferase [Caulobacteraceae bacterium]|nr:acyltransferase [Caulobacteraceae bacterium]
MRPASLAAEERRRTYHTLDALRGAAALIIVSRHCDQLLGGVVVPQSFLAVDLFFVLSGVVIANAYEARLLGGLSLWAFIKIRLIRLYPLYLIGIVLGFVQHEGQAIAGHAFSPVEAALALTLAAFMLLNFSVHALNGPRWTLFYEMLSNLIYASFIRRLTDRRLCGVIGLSALVLTCGALWRNSLDIGYRFEDVAFGVARVCYSFFLGVMLWRTRKGGARKSGPLAWLLVALCAAILLAPITGAWSTPYGLFAALIVFPAMVRIAMSIEVGPRAAKVFGLLGVLSYATYILHQPASSLFEVLLHRAFKLDAAKIAPYGYFAFLALLILACLAIDKLYDLPARRWLTRRYVGR